MNSNSDVRSDHCKQDCILIGQFRTMTQFETKTCCLCCVNVMSLVALYLQYSVWICSHSKWYVLGLKSNKICPRTSQKPIYKIGAIHLFFSYRLTSYSYILYFISVVSINCPRKFRNRFTFVQIKAIFSFKDNLFNWMPKLNGIWLLKIDRQSKLLCVPFKRCDSRFCNYVFKCTQQFTQNNVYFGCDWYGFSMLQNANKSSNFSPSFDFVLNTHTKSTQNNPSHKSFQ